MSSQNTPLAIAKALFFNLLLMSILGFLTIDSEANLNSRIGALISSFFIPLFLVYWTPSISSMRRTLTYGVGLIIYTILCFIFLEFSDAITSGAVPCFLLALGTLYFGDMLGSSISPREMTLSQTGDEG